MLIYREKVKEWMGSHRVSCIFEKHIFVDWKGKEKHFNLTQVLQMPREQRDRELNWLHQGIEQFKSNPSLATHNRDPVSR